MVGVECVAWVAVGVGVGVLCAGWCAVAVVVGVEVVGGGVAVGVWRWVGGGVVVEVGVGIFFVVPQSVAIGIDCCCGDGGYRREL